ncbi:hypothetical protein, partial [Dysosmobacter sp.]|uniref:hypothetical protein n=1 Tax=Dysosmobacter sp. TaxID=2591382 RepID=UPI002A8A3065
MGLPIGKAESGADEGEKEYDDPDGNRDDHDCMKKRPVRASFRLSKKSDGLFRRLHNTSIFWPLCCPKICRCAAQTPAGAGFLQA